MIGIEGRWNRDWMRRKRLIKSWKCKMYKSELNYKQKKVNCS